MIEHMPASQALRRAWRSVEGDHDGGCWSLLPSPSLAIGLIVFVMAALIFAATIAFGEAIGTRISDFLLAPLTTLALFEIMTVGSTAAYAGLRQAHEGAGGWVAQVFD